MAKFRDILFGREPVLLLTLVQAGLGVLMALHVLGFSAAQVPLIMALLTALLGALQAVFTRPWVPAAFTALIGAGAELLGGYGYHVSPVVLTSIYGVVTAIPPLLVRLQVTPTAKLRAQQAGQRPVRPVDGPSSVAP